ncbi:tetraspanin-36-like, partial [Python bivittatus]|uniref:Tetraspanin n=1 Tax=Python bivittatus TaxID=176946 RepID=A0A9F2QWW7_PYTBI
GAAVGLLYVGAHVLNAYKEYEHFLQDPNAFLPAIVIIGTAVVMLVIGLVGCCATLRESKIGLGVFLVIILLIFIAEMASIVLGFIYKGKIKTELHEPMSKSFAAYNGKTEDSHLVDLLQQELQCCGVYNYTDWKGTQWFNATGNHTVPMSCCKQGLAMKNCTGRLSEPWFLNTQGCEVVVELVLNSLLNYALLVVLAFAIVKLFGMVGICFLACKKENSGYQPLNSGVFA